MPGSLFDFGLFFFHNARKLLDKGSGPYFYLPKLESHLEARLWNDVFLMAQDELGIPRGSIRATVLIETIPAAFEMDEILYELREHSAGLNCGRWDYIFSIIKKFRKHPEFTMPDRAQVTMTAHCMHSYSLLAIKTCHRRGIHAMGGMAAQIPIKNDPAGQRRGHGEGAGRQGPRGRRRPRRHLGGPPRPGADRQEVVRRPHAAAQPDRPPPRRRAGDGRRLAARSPRARSPSAGCAHNIDVGIQYMAAWLGGNGCVPHLQPDGRRRHGGNLPRPDLAVGSPAQRRPGRRPARSRRTWSAGCSRSRWTNCAKTSGAERFARGNFAAGHGS